MSKILLVGDPHMRSELSYNSYVNGGRDNEKQAVLDMIVEQSVDCSTVIILGDLGNTRNLPNNVAKEITSFIERFGNKEVFLLQGNHDLSQNGGVSFGFLGEVKDKNWHIITGKPEKFGEKVFLPYITNPQLEAKNNEDARDKIIKMLPDGKILFLHHSISNFFTGSGQSVADFHEVILPFKEISKKYELTIGGHIHAPNQIDNIIMAGSIFTYSVGSTKKFIYKVDEENLKVEKIELPCRPIIKLENPTEKQIDELEPNTIVKIIITKQLSSIKKEKIFERARDRLSEKGGAIFLDQTSKVRKRQDYDVNLLDLDINKLLELYAKERDVDINKLKSGFELIRN